MSNSISNSISPIRRWGIPLIGAIAIASTFFHFGYEKGIKDGEIIKNQIITKPITVGQHFEVAAVVVAEGKHEFERRFHDRLGREHFEAPSFFEADGFAEFHEELRSDGFSFNESETFHNTSFAHRDRVDQGRFAEGFRA